MQKCIQTSSKPTQNKDSIWHDETTCNSKQVSYRACSKWSNGAAHTLQTSLKDKLSKTTRHLTNIKTTCYNTSTWKQKAWKWYTGKALQNMNTELSQKSLEHAQKDMARLQIITDSDLAEITRHGRNNIRLLSLELSTICYRNIS